MFEKIRKPGKTKSLFAYIIFFFICFVFVFLGVPIDSLSGAGGFAAIVNKEVISVQQFSDRLEQLQQNSLKKTDANSQKENSTLVMNQLINETLIFYEAKKSHLMASDLELRDTIISFPFLQENNKFKQSLYQSFLSQRRMSASDFEDQIRKWLITSRVDSVFRNAVSASSLEQERNSELEQFEIQLKYVHIALTDNSKKEMQKWQDLLSFPKQLEKELKTKKLKWMDGQKVSLKNWNQVLPIVIDKEELFEHFTKKLPHRGLIPKLFVDSKGVAITYLKHFKRRNKKSSTEGPSLNQILSFAISQMIFSSWLDDSKKMARIRMNPKIL